LPLPLPPERALATDARRSERPSAKVGCACVKAVKTPALKPPKAGAAAVKPPKDCAAGAV
jgi:hypothetical protein